MTRLAEIRARLDAATPGPWMCKPSVASWDLVISRHPSVPSGAIARAHTDGVFIAHAPQDLAWLLEVVERLRAALDTPRQRVVSPVLCMADTALDPPADPDLSTC